MNCSSHNNYGYSIGHAFTLNQLEPIKNLPKDYDSKDRIGHLVVTCWGRADILVCLFIKFSCVFVIFPCAVLGRMWYLIYRFLIFAFLLTSIIRVGLSVLCNGPMKSLRTLI